MENNHQLTHTEQPEDNPGKFNLHRRLEIGLTLILYGGLVYLSFRYGQEIGQGYITIGLGVIMLISTLIGKLINRGKRNPAYSDAWYDDPNLQPRRQKYKKMMSRGMIFSLLMLLFLGLSQIYDDWIETFKILEVSSSGLEAYELPDSIKPLALIGGGVLKFLWIAFLIIGLINAGKRFNYMPVYKDAKLNSPKYYLQGILLGIGGGLLMVCIIIFGLFLWFNVTGPPRPF